MKRRNLWFAGSVLAVAGLLTLAWIRGGDRATRLIEEPVMMPQAPGT